MARRRGIKRLTFKDRKTGGGTVIYTAANRERSRREAAQALRIPVGEIQERLVFQGCKWIVPNPRKRRRWVPGRLGHV